ncbi:SOS response-associated peptidase [Kaistia terrae]|uniref:Abasic site processing protein n=1 Tax=Kaistia terrae TaxID=537017 RepID=A0ABW0Q0X4_9HYPH|nr:SOS response-associated peptidase [Kaistia terrae]MCX5576682.1 SOS response-associated peptidase [Kaistia terrae]
MCGRYALAVQPEDVEAEFSMIRIEWFPPRYNIAPTQPILIVRGERGQRRPALVRWGLIPSWTKDMAAMPLLFNARSETAAEKPAFRGAYRHRRCLIPATGFYEWRKDANGRKQPFYLQPASGGVIAFAGLWDEWADDKGNIIDTATILTTAANRELAPIHERMPVVVRREQYDLWLGLDAERDANAGQVLLPPPDGTFEPIPIGAGVNSFRNDDPAIQARAVLDVVPEASSKKKSEKPVDSGQLKLF